MHKENCLPGRWSGDSVLCHLEEVECLQQTGQPTVVVKNLHPKPVLAWQNSWCATTAQSEWRYGQVGLVHHRTRVWVGPMRQITSVALAAEL